MEDQSITRAKSVTTGLRLYHSPELNLGEKPPFVEFCVRAESPKKLGSNEYWITAVAESFHLVGRSKQFNIPISSFNRWMDAWAGLQAPPTLSANKLHKVIRRFASTIVDAKLVTTGKNQALTTFLGREETRELERAWRSPHMLPRVVLGLKDFSEYETCQLIIHERGRASAESWGCSKQQDLNFSKTSAKNFTKIFNFVRKSKSKLFDQGNAMLEDVQVVGNFLAKEFSFQNHSALLFLSRNGFLPPTNDELISFNSLAGMISPYLDRLLTQEMAGERLSQLILLMENLPLSMEILDSNDVVIFENKSFENRDDSVETTPNKIQLPSSYTLVLYEEVDHSFDIDHHRRVSLLGELLNTLQHELNNPLFGLNLGSLGMAEDTLGETAQIFRDIATNSTRCQTIIKNFSQLYSSSKSDTEINLNEFLNEVFILTKSEIRGIGKEIVFENFDSSTDYNLTVNPISLSQVLFNLIINAGQAIKSYAGDDTKKLRNGEITLRVNRLPTRILFSVEDNGPGLPPAFFDNALKPFYTTKSQGTGLGLTISRGLLEAIGSTLVVSNKTLGSGAVFTFELPIS